MSDVSEMVIRPIRLMILIRRINNNRCPILRGIIRLDEFNQDACGVIPVKVGNPAAGHVENAVGGDMAEAHAFALHQLNRQLNVRNGKGNMVDAGGRVADELFKLLRYRLNEFKIHAADRDKGKAAVRSRFIRRRYLEECIRVMVKNAGQGGKRAVHVVNIHTDVAHAGNKVANSHDGLSKK